LPQTLPDRFDFPLIVESIEELLVRDGVLNNDLRFTVDRKHFGLTRPLQPLNVRLGISLKIRQRANIPEIDHVRGLSWNLLRIPSPFYAA
jgi:hypothetical protein